MRRTLVLAVIGILGAAGIAIAVTTLSTGSSGAVPDKAGPHGPKPPLPDFRQAQMMELVGRDGTPIIGKDGKPIMVKVGGPPPMPPGPGTPEWNAAHASGAPAADHEIMPNGAERITIPPNETDLQKARRIAPDQAP